MMLMKHLSYVDFWEKMFIFYLFFVDVHNWHGAPNKLVSELSKKAAGSLGNQTKPEELLI